MGFPFTQPLPIPATLGSMASRWGPNSGMFFGLLVFQSHQSRLALRPLMTFGL